jgi:Zn-dependent alcohol dehydrogenase
MSTNQRVSMKAVQVSEFGGPSVLKVQDIPVPTPAKGQVLVKVFATGINPVEVASQLISSSIITRVDVHS